MIKKLGLIISCVFLLSACGATKTNTTPTKAPTAQTGGVFEIADKDKPYISLAPTSDGHWLNMKIDKVPATISSIELWENLYFILFVFYLM